MAIRNIKQINNAINIKADVINLRKKQIKEEVTLYVEKIEKTMNDVQDILDTFVYCTQKGFIKQMNYFKGSTANNGFYLYETKSKKSGETQFVLRYCPCGKSRAIECNGTSIKLIKVGGYGQRPSTLDELVDIKYHQNVDSGEETYICPIYTDDTKSNYFVIDYHEVLEVLQNYVNNFQVFADKFFNAVDNLGNN